ncbi:MAG: lytic transglycosylase domain-containing protein [Oscillospiraceae bacterium]|nr:lytic transglycosylase domain-containing protein [Oscillospiraceae bacterium]
MKKHKRKLFWAAGALLLLAAFFCLALVLGWFEKLFYPIKYEEYVERYAQEYEVDPYFVYAVIRTESGFNPQAVSVAQARGLMQITEETFKWLQPQCAPGEMLTFDDLYRPEVNIRFGVYYLSRCLERYGDVSTAAASYHSGWGTVDGLLEEARYSADGRTLLEFPHQQMNHYVAKIEQSYEKYLALYQKEGN